MTVIELILFTFLAGLYLVPASLVARCWGVTAGSIAGAVEAGLLLIAANFILKHFI